MLSLFPSPREDELLYSVLARYVDLRNLKDAWPSREILLGSPSAPIAYGLPTRLNYLISIMPAGHSYTSELLIARHTLFPFYAPFVPPSRVIEIMALMQADTLTSISVKIGINATRSEKPKHLRFCSVCVQQEREQLGFCYWHRSHQLPQIDVCLKHIVWLEESTISTDRTKKQFIMAESAIPSDIESQVLNPHNPFESIVITLAQDAVWLLNQPPIQLGPEQIIKRYCVLLSRAKFASSRGKPNLSRIRSALREMFGNDTLEQLSHPLGAASSRDWLYRLFVLGKTGLFQNPVSHLLFMQFLRVSPYTFFSDRFDMPLFSFAQINK